MSPRDNSQHGHSDNENERSPESHEDQLLEEEIAQLKQEIQDLDHELQLNQDNSMQAQLMTLYNEGMFSIFFFKALRPFYTSDLVFITQGWHL